MGESAKTMSPSKLDPAGAATVIGGLYLSRR